MSVKKFKFVSPGIFINEIDNSQLTKVGADIGPVIIGRTLRGPAMRPVQIQSFADFIETFGEPVAGGVGGDVWRDGNRLGPTYAAYAAQAYLRNASPITFVRLLGEDHEDATSKADKAGWEVPSPETGWGADGAPGAFGLMIANGGTEGVKATGTIVVNAVLGSDVGFPKIQVGGVDVTGAAVENSAGHQAVGITMVAQVANTTYSVGSGGVQTITIDRINNDTTASGTRSYTISDNNDAVGADIEVVAGGETATSIADKVAAHINSVDGDLLEAAVESGSAVLVVRNKTRGLNTNVLRIAKAGGNLGALKNVHQVKAFSAAADGYAFDAADVHNSAVTADGAISIAKACEAVSLPLQSLTVENHAVDLEIAKQIAAEIDGDGAGLGSGTWSASAASASDMLSAIVTVTHPDFGDKSGAPINLAASLHAHGAEFTSTAIGSVVAGTEASYTMDGALAAIIYCKKGAVSLVGKDINDGTKYSDGINAWVQSDGSQNQFKLRARNVKETGAGTITNAEDVAFSFDKNSRLYIRNVLNTNPTLCNTFLLPTGETGKLKSYFLGQTFDRHLADVQGDGGVETGAGKQFACLVPLKDAMDSSAEMSAAMSPWVISQHNGDPTNFDLDPANTPGFYSGQTTLESKGIEKLFRFSSLYSGEWERKNLKISIYDIKAPTDRFNPYGSFSVMLRKAGDMDASPQVVERFSSCNLNPASPDFIARKIGDMESKWDSVERRYVNHGLYENQSRFIRVVLASSVAAGAADPRLLPFGFVGPVRRAQVQFTSSAASVEQPCTVRDASGSALGSTSVDSIFSETTIGGLQFTEMASARAAGASSGLASRLVLGKAGVDADLSSSWTLNMKFPRSGLRTSSSDSTLSSPRDAFFGISTNERGSSTVFEESYGDIMGFGAHGAAKLAADPCALGNDSSTGDYRDEHQFIFTLDDIRYDFVDDDIDPNRVKEGKPSNYKWVAGCHAIDYTTEANPGKDAKTCSITAYAGMSGGTGASLDDTPRERSYEAILDLGIDKFTLPLVGGHDGLNIFEIDPFGYHKSMTSGGDLAGSSDSALTHYALNSVKKAIDTVSDPEVVEMNLLAMPGLVHPALTAHAVQVCETRGDSLAIIDIDGDYQPTGLDARTEAERMPNVTTAITELRKRAVNSSYGCCFFPWVQISDSMSGRVLWAPPSIVALGTMASSSKRSELWFAPAGFTRGGLTDGAAGIGVNGVRLRLNSRERDKLYEANINPIAQFPAEGIVIFGQKTLQLTPSALDRINVRRLMIYLKKQISRFAKTVLFDQNVQQTWARFISKADPFLASVKSRFGLTEYKIVLDETTTTSELIDRNIMYAKILLKPAKAIEYIAIDFVITDSGASFDD